jgi:phage terminase large subunit-like protein
VLIEDKANGPAVIDSLQEQVSGLIPVEPKGSKQARAFAASGDIEVRQRISSGSGDIPRAPLVG